MHRLLLRVFVLTLLAGAAASCAGRPQPTLDTTRMFDVRGIAVTANGGISGGILTGVQRQTEMAIAATTYAVPKPRGVINVHIASVERDRAGRAQAEVSVTLSDVASGQPVLIRGYLVLASSERGRVSDAALADAIAMRLRYEFGLSMPPIRHVVRMDPDISTKLSTDRNDRAKPAETVVIPLRTAPLVGANQDPMLNSSTRIEPEVDPARVEPVLRRQDRKPVKVEPPAEATVESGAKTKVVIKPQPNIAEPDQDEPCVETLDTKC
jgi:hypothetical protein